MLARRGEGRFESCSAGSQPKGEVHPLALALLEDRGFDTSGLRSKSWDELAQAGASQLDFVFTVCDNAAGETCPVWPGRPVTAHWGIADPAAATGTEAERRAAFERAYAELERRIDLFLQLDLEMLEPGDLAARLREIGRIEGATEGVKS